MTRRKVIIIVVIVLLIPVLILGLVTILRPPPADTIDVVAKWTGTEEANFRSVLSAFVEQRDRKTVVQYHSIQRDIGEELRERVERGGPYDQGGPPDIAILPQTGAMTKLIRLNALQPVSSSTAQLVHDNYTGFWRQLTTVNDILYGVFVKANHKSLFWYSAPTFRDANVREPETWVQLQAVVKALADRSVTPLAVGGGDAWNLTDWFENIYLRTAGEERYRRLACRQIRFTDPTVKDALATMAQVVRSDWIAGGRDAIYTTYEKSVEQVFSSDRQRAAMLSGADYTASEIAKYASVEARYFPFPSFHGERPSLLVGGDVAVQLRRSAAGNDLINFLAKPEAAKPWADLAVQTGGFISPNLKVNPKLFPDELFAVVDAVRSAGDKNAARYDLSDSFPSSFGSTDRKGMFKIFQDFLWDGPSSLEATASRLEEQASVAVPTPWCP
ncbi:MAG: ABC transporter substrate-binding protein [Acidimicrobiales bacterium]